MEEPRQLNRYLGCEHEFTQQLVKGHFDPRLAWTVGNPPDKEQPDLRFGPEGLLSKDIPKPETTIRFIKYCESSFMQACVDRYIELCEGKYPKKLQKVERNSWTRASRSSTRTLSILSLTSSSIRRWTWRTLFVLCRR